MAVRYKLHLLQASACGAYRALERVVRDEAHLEAEQTFRLDLDRLLDSSKLDPPGVSGLLTRSHQPDSLGLSRG